MTLTPALPQALALPQATASQLNAPTQLLEEINGRDGERRRSGLVHSCRLLAQLAICDMKTLYIRDVPPEVSDGLSRLAERAGMSVSGFVLRELMEISLRANNPELLDALPDRAVPVDAVLAELDAGRSDR